MQTINMQLIMSDKISPIIYQHQHHPTNQGDNKTSTASW